MKSCVRQSTIVNSEPKRRIHMNVVPRSTMNTSSATEN